MNEAVAEYLEGRKKYEGLKKQKKKKGSNREEQVQAHFFTFSFILNPDCFSRQTDITHVLYG